MGISPDQQHELIKDSLFSLQKNFIEVVNTAKGENKRIIKDINSRSDLSDEQKNHLISVLNDSRARKGLDDFTSPFDSDGYDSIEIFTDNSAPLILVRGQRNFFKYAPPDEIIEKEVINTCDCKVLGCVVDIDFDLCSGQIEAIIVPGPGKVCGIFGVDSEYIIPFACIRKIGPDIILVEIQKEKFLKKI